jgi:hypothetical protein
LSVQEVDENGEEYHGDTYIVGVYIMKIETHRGLGIGDTMDRVFDLYGQPTAIQEYSAIPDLIMFIYQHGDVKIEVVFDETNSEVKYIFINYRMEQAEEDQFG